MIAPNFDVDSTTSYIQRFLIIIDAKVNDFGFFQVASTSIDDNSMFKKQTKTKANQSQIDYKWNMTTKTNTMFRPY